SDDFEPLEYPLAFTRRQVRVFGAIIQSFMAPMHGVWQRPSNGWRVASQLVGDHDPRLRAALTIKHPMQETLSGCLIASVLDQNIQDDAVLIDGSPQPVACATDVQCHLVQMRFVASSPSSS